jgi:acyl dehydratase
MEKELLVFDRLPKGREFTLVSEKLTEEKIKNFGEAIETENPLHVDRDYASKSKYRSIVAPPMIAYMLFRHSYLANATMPGGGVGLKMEFEFLKAAKLNETLTTRTSVADSYERDGKKFVTLEGVTENANGETVYISRLSAIWPK